ncbi:MAG: hypothetical protein QG588_880, partial [Candidatus Poribacteria bacterium]|nr:hypothetical protein [Candidatus Poribacteria bacterium]
NLELVKPTLALAKSNFENTREKQKEFTSFNYAAASWGCKPEPSKRLNLSRHHSAIMLYEF